VKRRIDDERQPELGGLKRQLMPYKKIVKDGLELTEGAKKIQEKSG
jgi:hypothetical protein